MSPAHSSSAPRKSATHLPGEPGVWVFIVGDMVVFALFFGAFVYYRAQDPPLYIESQRLLNQGLGAVNTLLMLSSSWFVAMAVQAARTRAGQLSTRFFALAFLCGAGFITVKIFEWGEKIHAGISLTTNDFFMYYFMLTGIHLLHVVIGMGVITLLWNIARQPSGGTDTIQMLESGASFWHLVDMLWVIIFALLYLMK